MFRLNFWPRPFLGGGGQHGGSSSGHVGQGASTGAALDYSGGGGAGSVTGAGGAPAGAPYMPLPLSASPALMVLAASGASESSGCHRGGARSSAPLQVSDDASDQSDPGKASSSSTLPPPAPHSVITPHHHTAFGGGAFPFFRHAPSVSAAAGNADTAAAAAAAAALQHQLPPIFSHLHQSLLRSHFDSAIAAAQLHQARLGAAALLGHRLAAGSIGRHHHHHHDAGINGPAAAAAAAAAAYPSAFLPAVKRLSGNATNAREAPVGFYHHQYIEDDRSTTTTSPVHCWSRAGSSAGRAHSGKATPSSRIYAGSQHSVVADDDDCRRPVRPDAAAGSSGCSPMSFVESEPTSDHIRDVVSPATHDQSPAAIKGLLYKSKHFVQQTVFMHADICIRLTLKNVISVCRMKQFA